MGMKLAGVMFLITCSITGISYWYYKQSQQTIADLTENNVKLQQAVSISEETIKTLQSDYKKIAETLETVNTEFQAIRNQNNILANKLEEHDLTYLASKKPGLVQRVINNASGKALRCFEILSGSELNESEKNAKNGKEFNSECPWVFDSINAD